MNKIIKCILIAFLMFSSAICYISINYFRSLDSVAVYTKNNLSWSDPEIFEDGSVKVDLTKGERIVQLKNSVQGNIGYNIYLYTEKETLNEVKLSAKDIDEIDQSEYPDSLNEYDVKCAYSGYIEGNEKKNFKIKSAGDMELRLLIIIEDNNSYPKEENLPTIANVKFNAEVLLDGQYPRGKDYSFSLKNEAGEVIETVHNDDGYITFSNISLKEKGTFIYYLSQNEGKDTKTTYDESVYKLEVLVEGKNIARVFYEKDGIPKETLPRFSNYKEDKNGASVKNVVEYPINEKKSVDKPDYLLIVTIVIAVLLILFYIVTGRKKG